MNKIFKVIWNAATQSWVAVSELQKAKGKTKSQAKAAVKSLIILSGMGFGALQTQAATLETMGDGRRACDF